MNTPCGIERKEDDTELKPRDADVAMGRGKEFSCHPGNMLYADLVNDSRDRYFTIATPLEKRDIIKGIVGRIQEQGGRFLKRDASGGGWVLVSKDRALTKTASAIQYRQRKTAPQYKDAKRGIEPLSFKTLAQSFNDKPAMISVVDVPMAIPPLTTISVPSNPIVAGNCFSEPDACTAHHHDVSDETALVVEMNTWLEQWEELENEQIKHRRQPRRGAVGPGDYTIWCVPPAPRQCTCLHDMTVLACHDSLDADNHFKAKPSMFFGAATRRTSLGEFRVSSVGSLISMDDESMTDMDW